MKRVLFVIALTLTLAPISCPQATAAPAPATGVAEEAFAQFEAELETLRQQLKIPGMSAAIVQDQELVWAKGFGYVDLEKQVAATADTPYHLASVTKPVAATLLMQLVEEGILGLDDPVSDYGVHLESKGTIRVRHLLTHTSAGVPGTRHIYDGNRYAYLGQVIEAAAGKPFGELLAERILTPLGMSETAPNPGSGWEGILAMIGLGRHHGSFPRVYRALAKPYQFDATYNIVPGTYSLHFSPAAGLLSSVVDLAKFDIALDRNQILRPETKELMWAPAVSTYSTSTELMYGLGWYTQQYKGTRLIWHAGRWPPSVSALYLKVPEENLTFIILANTDNLSTPYNCLGYGDVLCSTPALAFYRTFVLPQQSTQAIPDIDWEADERTLIDQLGSIADGNVRDILERELWSYRQLFASVGQRELVNRLWSVHRQVFSGSSLHYREYITAVSSEPRQPSPQAVGVYHLVWIGYGLLTWFILTAGSLVYLFWSFFRSSTVPWGIKLAWVFMVTIFGPLALLVYLLHKRPSRWRRALRATLYSVAGNTTGLGLLLALYVVFFPGSDSGPAVLVAPLAIGWLCFRAPLLATQVEGKHRYWQALRRTLLAEIVSTNLVLAGMFPAIMFLSNRWFPNVEPTSPLFWGFVALAAIAGALVSYPYNLWIVRRGLDYWPEEPATGQESPGGRRAVETPSLRSDWGTLLLSLILLAIAVGASITAFA